MPIEQRVVSGSGPLGQTSKITPRPRVTEPVEPPAQESGSRKVSLKAVIVSTVLIVALVLGAVYWFVVRPALDDGAPPPIIAGAVHTVDSINLNLSDGHYLRLGFAVQLTDQAQEVDSAQILDAAITVFSGQKYDNALDPVVREGLRQQLAAQLDRVYEGEVMEVYFTDYVAQ
ncbi:flagellar basal body-associated FliL family protein [Jonesiaceae bacterium BS-20]|uniref:Flagellar protein FliL n=1 Tax=Jonesiaceae bacterium BS-20 TaxID=3120821 RepID=A0AAU7DYL3_9MICO